MRAGWRSEWRVIAADRTVFALIAILLAAGGYGVSNGLRWVRVIGNSSTVAQDKVEQDIRKFTEGVARFERDHPDAGPDWDSSSPIFRGYPGIPPGTLAIAGYNAALPIMSLAPLAVGQADLYPAYTKVSLWNNRHDLFSEAENENPLHLLNGRFDLAFVVVYLYPLLILAVTYNLISGEREHGTLALLASQPAGVRTVMLRRAALLLAVVTAPAAALGIMGATISGIGIGDSAAWLRLALWVAQVTVYGAFWFALALAVNSRRWASPVNATALASVWLALVLVLPALLNLAVTTMAPAPSRLEYVQALRDAANESEEAAQLLLAQYYEEHPEMRPAADGSGRKTSIYTYWLQKWNTARRMEPVLDRYEAALSKQDKLAAAVRFLSPAVLVQEGMNDLAGTGAERYRRFREAATSFQREWHAFFAPRMFQGYRMTSGDYVRLPRFRMPEEDGTMAFGRAAVVLGGVLLPTVLLIIAAYRGIRRQSVV